MLVIVMGVSGAGKTTVGRRLAEDLGWDFLDADDFHSAGNIAKMRAGVPLTDEDRVPWLEAMAAALRGRAEEGRSAVLAASVLKESHRDRLRVSPDVRFVYLKGDYHQLRERLDSRRGHFFGPDLLASQLQTLEEPRDALVVDIGEPADVIARRVIEALKLQRERE